MSDGEQWSSPVTGGPVTAPVSTAGSVSEGVPLQTPWDPGHYTRKQRSVGGSSSRGGGPGSTSSAASTTTRGTGRSTGSVFDKLTDHTQFTGAHKARFDASGRGRGKVGRTERHEAWADPKAGLGSIVRNPEAPTVPAGVKEKRGGGGGGGGGGGVGQSGRQAKSKPQTGAKRQPAGGRRRATSPRHPYRSDIGVTGATAVERALLGEAAAATSSPTAPSRGGDGTDDATDVRARDDDGGVEEDDDGEDPVDFLVARRAQSVERAARRSRARDEHEAAAAERRVAAHNLRAEAARVEREGDAEEAKRKMEEGIAQLEAALAAVQNGGGASASAGGAPPDGSPSQYRSTN